MGDLIISPEIAVGCWFPPSWVGTGAGDDGLVDGISTI